MDKNRLLMEFNHVSRGNFFSIEIASNVDGESIEQMTRELEKEGKIKIRECVQKESLVYVQGIIKYSST
ncbi:hypothetical protein V6B33_02975 [Mangrovibacillus sp. Mu-81]|jgi:hypothetical protein|uniref:hypothetical protein n=1 Tax=Mangrovibacillus sp. Mu-81 TaxID=3121478 RepID=UPI002FE49E12